MNGLLLLHSNIASYHHLHVAIFSFTIFTCFFRVYIYSAPWHFPFYLLLSTLSMFEPDLSHPSILQNFSLAIFLTFSSSPRACVFVAICLPLSLWLAVHPSMPLLPSSLCFPVSHPTWALPPLTPFVISPR